jgi:hypothetical protein
MKYKLTSHMFIGSDQFGNHTYQITFNQSLKDTIRMNGIEDGLNDRVLRENREVGDKIIHHTETRFGIRGRIIAAITILFGGTMTTKSAIDTYHVYCHTGKSEASTTIVAPEWFNRIFRRRPKDGLMWHGHTQKS